MKMFKFLLINFMFFSGAVSFADMETYSFEELCADKAQERVEDLYRYDVDISLEDEVTVEGETLQVYMAKITTGPNGYDCDDESCTTMYSITYRVDEGVCTVSEPQEL